MFSKKTWKDRVVEFPNRRMLTDSDSGDTSIVTVSRNEGTVTEIGDAFNATNMNSLETRIKTEADNLEASLASVQSSATASSNITKGSYFLYNGRTYKATANINRNSSIVPGTNCSTVAILDEVKANTTKISKNSSSISSLNTALSRLESSVNSSVKTLDNKISAKPNLNNSKKNVSVAFSNGSATVTFNLSSYTSAASTFPGVIVNGIGVADVFAASITNASPANFTIIVKDLTRTTYTGNLQIGINLIGGF